MSHMEPQVTRLQSWSLLGHEDYSGERLWIPSDNERDAGDAYDVVERREGYGVRFSAPGYVDSTDWVVVDSLAEAIGALFDQTPFEDREGREEIHALADRILSDCVYSVEYVPTFDPKNQPVEAVWIVDDGRDHAAPKSVHLHASDAYLKAVRLGEKTSEEYGGLPG